VANAVGPPGRKHAGEQRGRERKGEEDHPDPHSRGSSGKGRQPARQRNVDKIANDLPDREA